MNGPTALETRNDALVARARAVMPGGVSSPVRAFKAVGGQPLFIARGEGAYLYDVDGNQYIDYVGSWGPLILGHAHPDVLAAITQAASRGTSQSHGTHDRFRARTHEPEHFHCRHGRADLLRELHLQLGGCPER